MEKKSLQIFLVFTYFTFSNFFFHSAAQAEAAGLWVMDYGKSTATSEYPQIEAAAPISCVVIASEYCAFLNQNAAADPYHLYDEYMAEDAATACIARAGSPGRWHYEVIRGRESFPVCYVNKFDRESYCNETGNVVFNDDEICDSLLKSSQSSFQVDTSATTMLMLAVSSDASLTSSSYLKDAVGIAGFIGLLACPELMIRFGSRTITTSDTSGRASGEGNEMNNSSHSWASSGGSIDSVKTSASLARREQYALNFDDFKEAAFDYPMADIFEIDHEYTGQIKPRSETSLNLFENNKSNKRITLVFKDALKEEYRTLLGEYYLPELTSKLINGEKNKLFPALGSSEIFNYRNRVERRITKKIEALKESNMETLNFHLERKRIILDEAQQYYEKHQAAFENKNLDKTFLGKTAHNIGVISEVVGDGEVAAFGFKASLGTVFKGAVTAANAANRAIEKAPMKSAREIFEEAQADIDQVQEIISLLQKKGLKEKRVAFSNTESMSLKPSSYEGYNEDNEEKKRTHAMEVEAQNLWENALQKEVDANDILSSADNPKNAMAACRLASIAWSKTAEAKATLLSLPTTTSETDQDRLAEDIKIAENKVEEWMQILESMRPKKIRGSVTNTIVPSYKRDELSSTEPTVQENDAKAVSNLKAEADLAIAEAKTEFERKAAADAKRITDAEKIASDAQEAAGKLAAQIKADKEAHDIALAEAKADAEKKAAANAKAFEERFLAIDTALKNSEIANVKQVAESKKAAMMKGAEIIPPHTLARKSNTSGTENETGSIKSNEPRREGKSAAFVPHPPPSMPPPPPMYPKRSTATTTHAKGLSPLIQPGPLALSSRGPLLLKRSSDASAAELLIIGPIKSNEPSNVGKKAGEVEAITLDNEYIDSQVGIIKAGIAKVKQRASRHPDGIHCGAKSEKADNVLGEIREEMWPTFSKALQDFRSKPSEKTLAIAQQIASAYGSVTALASASAKDEWEAADAAEAAKSIADANEMFAAQVRTENVHWLAIMTREVAEFTQAVEEFKKVQQLSKAKPGWMKSADPFHTIFQCAREVNTEEIWNEAAKEAKKMKDFYDYDGLRRFDLLEYSGIDRLETANDYDPEVDYWAQKVIAANVKALATRPLIQDFSSLDDFFYNENQINKMMALVRTKVWPLLIEKMDKFIRDPSEAAISKFLRIASVSSSASASAYAYTSAYSTGSDSYKDCCYDHTSAHASASVSAYAFGYDSASNYESEYGASYDDDTRYLYASSPAFGYAYASTYAYTSTYAYAAASAASAEEATNIARAAAAAADGIKILANRSKKDNWNQYYAGTQANMDGAVDIVLKVAEFARAVAAFREGPEAFKRLRITEAEIKAKEVRAKAAEEARANAAEKVKKLKKSLIAAKQKTTLAQERWDNLSTLQRLNPFGDERKTLSMRIESEKNITRQLDAARRSSDFRYSSDDDPSDDDSDA